MSERRAESAWQPAVRINQAPMDSPPTNSKDDSWIMYAISALLICGLFVWAAIGYLQSIEAPHLTSAVNNARQIYLASFNMANDFEVNRDPHLGWPGDLAVSSVDPVHNLSEFAERLVAGDYVKRADLDKIFSAPGVPRYPGKGLFEARFSAFKIYLATDDDAPDVLFCASKNFTFGRGLDPALKPYGERGFVFVRKGGDARGPTIGANDLATIGLMPGHKSAADPGEETSENVWKD